MNAIASTNMNSAANALRILSYGTAAPGAVASAYGNADRSGNAVPPSRDTRIVLSLEAAEIAFGADSFLMQTASGRADSVEIEISLIPEDKEAYKAKILQQLKENMTNDPDFMAALNANKVTVLTADEVPELNFQPEVTFTLLQNGSSSGGGYFTPKGFNHEQLERWNATRGQAVLGSTYAFYEK